MNLDEFFDLLPEQTGERANAEFYLATMTSGSAAGLKIQIDGDSEGSEKSYKILKTGGEPPRSGDRVLVVKMSGTYIVLGKIGLPSNWWTMSTLNISSTSTTTQQIVNKINSIINMLINVGICKDGNS